MMFKDQILTNGEKQQLANLFYYLSLDDWDDVNDYVMNDSEKHEMISAIKKMSRFLYKTGYLPDI